MEEKQFKEEPFLISATCIKLEKIDQQAIKKNQFFLDLWVKLPFLVN